MTDENQTYRVIRLKDAGPNEMQDRLNEMDADGYRFVQGWAEYGRSAGVMLTVLVFERRGTFDIELDQVYQAELPVDDDLFRRELEAAERGAPMPQVDPLLAGLR